MIHGRSKNTHEKSSSTFTLRTDEEKISEFICENNRDYRPLFGK